MLGKKDNHDIFSQYRTILLEQAETKSFQSFIDKVRAANFDQRLKSEILELFGNPMVEKAYNILHRVGDADTAGYASYPEATPAQDDQETANEPDPEFAKEMAREREKQQKENPERLADEDDEYDAASFFQGGASSFDELPMKFPEKPIAAPKSANLPPKDPSMYRKDVIAHHKPATETIPNKIAGLFSGSEKSRISSSGGSHTKAKDPNWGDKSSEWQKEFARGARG
jgi:hypothetical protein